MVQERIDNIKVPIKEIKKAVDLYLQEEDRNNKRITYRLPERQKKPINREFATTEVKNILSKTKLENGVFTKTNNITVTVKPEKRLLSKYDRNSDSKKQDLLMKITTDFVRLNALQLTNSTQRTMDLIRMNFKKISEMNLIENEEIAGLNREELITVYSTFVAMFMVQEMDKKTVDNRSLEQINTVELETLR